MEIRQRNSLSDKAYNCVLSEILSGKLPAGTKLGEEALSKRLKVSRTPVREAIHRLVQDGLAERIPRCGCVVKTFQTDQIAEVFQCRQVLECSALELGFHNLPHSRIEQLLKTLDGFETLPFEEKTTLSVEVDDELHAIVTDVCPNTLMRDMIHSLQQQCRPFRNYRSLGEHEIGNITEERINILKAMAVGDTSQACSLLKDHILSGAPLHPAQGQQGFPSI